MKVIRNGIFETNSSSSHSITISSDLEWENPEWYEGQGILTIRPGEFGWGMDVGRDFDTKASYVLTYAKNLADMSSTESKERSKEILKMLKKVIKDYTGVKKIVFEKNAGDYYEWGYIDHQSFHECQSALGSEDRLKNFLFNQKSILVIDNDNH